MKFEVREVKRRGKDRLDDSEFDVLGRRGVEEEL